MTTAVSPISSLQNNKVLRSVSNLKGEDMRGGDNGRFPHILSAKQQGTVVSF
ncbi:MAG: hypothetical protein M5U34_19300 [Chloroflexi bacterium]|nr:hypothetical protein [Chloroflexota bacterium]